MNFSIAVKWDGLIHLTELLLKCGVVTGEEMRKFQWWSSRSAEQRRLLYCHYTEMELDTRWLELASAIPVH